MNPSEFVEYYVNYIYGNAGNSDDEEYSETQEDPYDYETPVPLQIDPPSNPPEMYLSDVPDIQCPSAEVTTPILEASPASSSFYFSLKETPSPLAHEFILEPTSSQELDNYFSADSLGSTQELQFDDSLCKPHDDIYFQISSHEGPSQQPQTEILLNSIQQDGFFIDDISPQKEQFVDINQFDISSKLLSSVTIEATPTSAVIFVQ